MKFKQGDFSIEIEEKLPENLEEYLDRYENNENGSMPEITKELAEAWLDSIIGAIEACDYLNWRLGRPLVSGRLDENEGEYENEIHYGSFVISKSYFGAKRYQIYRGIEKLAKILEIELQVDDNRGKNSGYRYEYFIEYQDMIIFQIEKYKLEETDENTD